MRKSGIKIALIYLFTLFSCKDYKQQNNILDVKTMAKIIVDLQINEAKVSKIGFANVDSSFVAYRYLEKKTYKNNQVDSLRFAKSYDYYSKNKQEMLAVYAEAERILEKLVKEQKNKAKPTRKSKRKIDTRKPETEQKSEIRNVILDKIKMSADSVVFKNRPRNTRPTQ